MEHDFVIAGFGGQGVLLAGLVLCHAGMNAGYEVAWIPSYGPEMRGGTANCTVIISTEEIGSPIVSRPGAAVAMNEPSLLRYASRLRPGGILVVNRSLATSRVDRADITVIELKAGEIAATTGNERAANMVALGALTQATLVLPLSAVEEAVAECLGADKERFVASSREALRLGALAARSAVPA